MTKTRLPDADVALLTRCAVVFEPADPPRDSTLAFYGAPLPAGDHGTIAVLTEDGTSLRRKDVPALRLPMDAAIPVLAKARRAGDAHPAAEFWGAALLIALQLVSRGRLLPGVSAAEYDAWRIGPLNPEDAKRVGTLSEAMPPQARAVPVPDLDPYELEDAGGLLTGFLDAVADSMARTPAAALATGAPAFASPTPQRVPALRAWARESAAGLDSGVRISLRLQQNATVETLSVVVQVHSLTDATLMADAAALWTGAAPGFGRQARMDTMVAVRRAARVWPVLDRLLATAVPDSIELGDDELGDLLVAATARLRDTGVEVHWPKELARDLTAHAVVRQSSAPPSDVRGFLSGDQVTEIDWQLALGGKPLTQQELDRIAESSRPMVRLRDQWVLIDPALAEKARDRVVSKVSPIDALGVALSGRLEVDGERVEVAGGGWLERLRARIAEPDEGVETVAAPEKLDAELRGYQLRGLRWLVRMTELGLGGCLADDMGLGKTITLIALHLHRGGGPTLVVCPASLLGNWEREIQRFAPGTTVRRFHGAGRSVEDLDEGFVLTTYGTMRRDARTLSTVDWDLVVADEAQHVKNSLSSTAKALRRIPGAARVALTGTPVENNLSELWAVLDWTTPGMLGTLGAFRSRWARPIEADNDTETAQRLSKLVAPFLLRRRKTDPGIAPELPAKTETEQPVSLTREQAGLYEATVRELMAQVAAADGIERRGKVLKLLTGLKQICNHPAQYLKESEPILAGRSGKLELLTELVETIFAENGSVLVFTQYVSMARLLSRHLTDRGVPSELLHGGTPVRAREESVQRFQNGDFPVFLLSLKAAGTGLNLTRAGHVIHYDRWWNPAVEQQATDRAYRIGQTQPVQVHKFVVEGTVEDRIAQMLVAKRELADSVLSGGEAALSELSNDELAELVRLR
jgi:superfamily II DNA or RNA helicase